VCFRIYDKGHGDEGNRSMKGSTGNGNTGSDRGTPGFINVPEPDTLSTQEIILVTAKIAEMNLEQVICHLVRAWGSGCVLLFASFNIVFFC